MVTNVAGPGAADSQGDHSRVACLPASEECGSRDPVRQLPVVQRLRGSLGAPPEFRLATWPCDHSTFVTYCHHE